MQFFAQKTYFCAKTKTVMEKNIAIFASGNGTNAENIIRYFQAKQEGITVSVIVANRRQAQVFERAERLQVPCIYMAREKWVTGEAVLHLLKEYQIDFIVLAGFLARVPDPILHAYPQQIINIHPSLLPKFGGKGMYGDRVHQAVVEAGEQESGITIQYINECYDEGDIIAQYRCPVFPEDTPQDVAQRVHALEYTHYPEIIEKLLTQHEDGETFKL